MITAVSQRTHGGPIDRRRNRAARCSACCSGVGILYTIGIILIIIGAVLWIVGSTGRAVGGGRHYY